MKQDEVLFFLASACVVVFAWIAFTILHNSLTSTISESANQAIIPIQPSFDTKTIDAMTAKTIIVPLNSIQPQVQSDITRTGTVPTQPVASQSAKIATEGATLQ